MKRFLAAALALALLGSATGCGNSNNDSSADNSSFKVYMVTDTGGVNDESFNKSAWEDGLKVLEKETGAQVGYIESTQASDYGLNLEKAVDMGCNVVLCSGFALTDASKDAARKNPDSNFVLIDNAGEDSISNLTGVVFRAEESAFIVGYIAGKTTTTNKIGFVGGIDSDVIKQFEYGYRAGADYAAKELGKKISVSVQYAESFSDSAKGKAIASKMFSNGCDIVFHSAGGAGVGVIEAAKEAGKFAIGVDRDQLYLAPKNVLTSALKNVGHAVKLVVTDFMNGEAKGGETRYYGIKDDCVGIPDNNPNMAPAVHDAAMKIEEKIKNGEIVPPYNESTYKNFKV